jgi:hypothetical protein
MRRAFLEPFLSDPFQGIVMNFENACMMPIGSGPWGIRTENDRFICSLAQ